MKSCDGKMWSGIQIQKGAFIDLEATALGGAQTAVQVQDSAILNIRGTVFDGNIIGIDVLPDAAPLGVPVFGNTFRNGALCRSIFFYQSLRPQFGCWSHWRQRHHQYQQLCF